MSGIGLIFNRNGRPVERSDIELMASALRPYGPEHYSAVTNRHVGFAYTHTTNTPEAKDLKQPLTVGGGRYVFLFDGRLDNREELAGQLTISLSSLAPLSDAELAAQCWERWQSETLNRWVGEFAILVWDSTEQQIIAARDQFGCRGLNYHLTDQKLVIASMPKGVHAVPGIARKASRQKLADHLSQLYMHTDESFYCGISRVSPASLLIVGRDSSRVSQYYDIRDQITDIRYPRDEDYVEAAEELLSKSAKAMMRSPGPVGAFMSGGLDSSTGAIFAKDFRADKSKRFPVFTSVPESTWNSRTTARVYEDETPHVEAIAKMHPDIELNLVDAAGLGLFYKQEDFINAAERPVRNAGNMFWWHAILEQAQSRGIKVMLDGTMGNMTLTDRGGDVFTELFENRAFGDFLRELRSDGGSLPRRLISFLSSRYFFATAPDWVWKSYLKLRRKQDGVSSWWAQSTVSHDFFQKQKVFERARANGLHYPGKPYRRDRERSLWILTRLVAAEIADTTKAASALYGMEIRDPFSNRRLLEWAFSIPASQSRRQGESRWLVKRLMAKHLPHSVLHKPEFIGRQSADWPLRLRRDQDWILAQLENLVDDPEISSMIEIESLLTTLQKWSFDENEPVTVQQAMHLYAMVPQALQTSAFLKYAE